MSTTDLFILFGPLLALVVGMILAFAIHHYNSNRSI
jgi:hypothetical protein